MEAGVHHHEPHADFVPAAGDARLTGIYDSVIALTVREGKLRGGVIEAVAAATAGVAEPRVLELGCGTGSLSLALERGVPGARVTGIDIDPKALGYARAKPGSERVSWLQGSITDPPPEAGSWDCVVISLVLHHLTPEQQPLALQRAREALRDGGTLHVVDFGPPHGPIPRFGFPHMLQRIDGRRNTAPMGNGELPGMIAAAGFTDVVLRQRFGTIWGTHERFSASR